jgi:hypothetical protein
MQRQAVESSNLESIGYDDEMHTLEVGFHGGAVYQYANVPQYLYTNLMAAQSKGAYFNREIKPHYTWTQRQEPNKPVDIRLEDPYPMFNLEQLGELLYTELRHADVIFSRPWGGLGRSEQEAFIHAARVLTQRNVEAFGEGLKEVLAKAWEGDDA